MTLETIRAAFGWCSLINMGLLIVWLIFFAVGRQWIYRFHSKIFPMSEERFNTIHYAGMAYFKIAIFILNLVPYLALRIVG